jgi:hypothetical protein
MSGSPARDRRIATATLAYQDSIRDPGKQSGSTIEELCLNANLGADPRPITFSYRPKNTKIPRKSPELFPNHLRWIGFPGVFSPYPFHTIRKETPRCNRVAVCKAGLGRKSLRNCSHREKNGSADIPDFPIPRLPDKSKRFHPAIPPHPEGRQKRRWPNGHTHGRRLFSALWYSNK